MRTCVDTGTQHTHTETHTQAHTSGLAAGPVSKVLPGMACTREDQRPSGSGAHPPLAHGRDPQGAATEADYGMCVDGGMHWKVCWCREGQVGGGACALPVLGEDPCKGLVQKRITGFFSGHIRNLWLAYAPFVLASIPGSIAEGDEQELVIFAGWTRFGWSQCLGRSWCVGRRRISLWLWGRGGKIHKALSQRGRFREN